MLNRQEFIAHMKSLYGPEYDAGGAYKIFKQIYNLTDSRTVNQLKVLTTMDTEKRLLYRYSLATIGIEFTPLQVDQYITLIDLAISNRQE